MVHRVALLGLGIMGRRMLSALRRHPDFRVSAAWDASPLSIERAKAEAPDLPVAADARSAVSTADLVYIATPPASHIEYARLALRSGRAVLCEKPLAVDLEDARRLVEEARALPNAVNFPFASSPAVLTLERLLREDPPRRVEIRLHFPEWPRAWQRDAGWLRGRREGGFVREVFSHFAYLTLRVLGPLELRSATVCYPDDASAETRASAELSAGAAAVHFCGGVGGAAPDSYEWTAHAPTRSLRLLDWRRLEIADGSGWRELPPDRPLLPHLADQLDAVSAMLRGEPHPLCSFATALQVQEVVEAILRGST